jgi:cyanophycin synthetase
MKILDLLVLRGPNYWSLYDKVISFQLDIGEFEDRPTDEIDGFYERIKQIMPGLYEHYCSEGRAGGFFSRIERGTWMGHVAEHIALELQIMAGMNCTYGKTRGTNRRGIYNVAFSYREERAGVYAAHASVRIAEALGNGLFYNIGPDIENLRRIANTDSLGPSTSAIVKAAARRNIPYLRLDQGSLVQLGHGSAMKRILASLDDFTSTIGVDLASDKHKSKILLKFSSVPVPEGMIVITESGLDEAIETLGYPVVIKPLDGNQGKGVSLNINTSEEAHKAFDLAKKISEKIIVETYLKGDDYRLLVIDYKVVAAARRTPAMVTGNGYSSIRELIHEINLDPSRGEEHEKILTKIKIDHSVEELLKSQNLTPDSVIADGHTVMLRQTANLSTGGTSEDVTDKLHPEIVSMAERVARIVGLDVCGIDLISENIMLPLKESKSVVIEVNASPGFRMHTNPYKGRPRHVGDAMIKMLFPGRSNGRIPIVAVTGTNGKTTTTRLIAHMARTAGYNTGFTTSDGIYINDEMIMEGDCTGPVSSEIILRDKFVDFAVFECARGGILRAGLAFDQSDCGIVTNVAEDHLGLRDINNLDDLAKVKSIIAETVRKEGLAVLNENNEYTYGMMQKVKCPVGLFSINPDSERIALHCSKGGLAAVYRDNDVVLLKGNSVILKENVEAIPISFEGKAKFMIENILAAILAGYSRNFEPEQILTALHTFIPSPESIPGRMNLFRFRNFSFLLDYAHNFHGISALGTFVKQYDAPHKVGIISTAGDRRDIDIINVGKASAGLFDRIIIRVDKDTRGRDESEIIDFLYAGIRTIRRNIPVDIIRNERDAVIQTVSNVIPGSLIVLFSEKIADSIRLLNDLKLKEEELVFESMHDHN